MTMSSNSVIADERPRVIRRECRWSTVTVLFVKASWQVAGYGPMIEHACYFNHYAIESVPFASHTSWLNSTVSMKHVNGSSFQEHCLTLEVL